MLNSLSPRRLDVAPPDSVDYVGACRLRTVLSAMSFPATYVFHAEKKVETNFSHFTHICYGAITM